uniref:Death domain-containing protein n=1 Tax=Amphimedon queenslandica TaxID=400682 RepID=A0A1X7T0C9_AMPQE
MILSRYRQGEELLGEIKEAVCANCKKLKAFADILCKYTATDDIGYSIMRDYREVYWSGDKVGPGPFIYLRKSVILEFKLMRLKLGETFFKVGLITIFNSQSPSIDDIKHVLGIYYTLFRRQLAQCKDISGILQLLCDKSPLDDISLLEAFVNEFNIKEAKPVIEEYKGVVKEFKMKYCLFLEEELLKVPSLLESVTVVTDKDTSDLVLKDVQRLSSAKSPYDVKLKVIRDDGSWKVRKQESYADSDVGPTLQSKDTTLTTEVPAGTAEKDEDQVMLLQEKVKSIQKELEEEKEPCIVIGKDYEALRSDNELTHKQLEELQKKLKEEIQTSSSLMKQKEAALREKEELLIKIDDLQQELELQQVKDHKEVSGQCEYTISQSEQALVEQKEEYKILQETETVHTCTYISKGDISQLSVILEPVEDDWYHIGQCLEVKESVLTEIKEMTPVDSRLTHVLETWCHEKDRTITELKESLKRMDRDDILEGLQELPTGHYTMNNDEEYDIDVKDSYDEVKNQIETENKEIQTTQT